MAAPVQPRTSKKAGRGPRAWFNGLWVAAMSSAFSWPRNMRWAAVAPPKNVATLVEHEALELADDGLQLPDARLVVDEAHRLGAFGALELEFHRLFEDDALVAIGADVERVLLLLLEAVAQLV